MKHKKPSPESNRKPDKPAAPQTPAAKKESGGPSGPEPTRYGDWERGGKCVDF